LALSGQIEFAEARVRDLSDPSVSAQERDRLHRFIIEAKGTNRTEVREKQFKATDSLFDLVNLVETLDEQKDWLRLTTYGRMYFERTRDLPACRVYAQALFETEKFREAVEVLSNHPDLIGQSADLESLFACRFTGLATSRNVARH